MLLLQIKLWIFPEGKRHNTGEIHPFKKGAFHLAIEEKLPILPVVFSQYYFLDEKNQRFDHGEGQECKENCCHRFLLGKVIVTPLPLISTEGMTAKDVDKLINRTREVMTATFHEVNKEINQAVTTNEVGLQCVNS